MTEAISKQKNAHVWQREENEWYCDEDWCFERLFQEEPFVGPIFDPSCGRGNVVRAARAAGYEAAGCDLVPPELRGDQLQYQPADFLAANRRYPNLASNPPFNLIDPRDKTKPCYLRRALQQTDHKVALILPTVWINARSWLRGTPLYRVHHLTPRPSMPPGHVLMSGGAAGSGTKDFSIYVWWHGYDGDPTFRWLHRDEGRARHEVD